MKQKTVVVYVTVHKDGNVLINIDNEHSHPIADTEFESEELAALKTDVALAQWLAHAIEDYADAGFASE